MDREQRRGQRLVALFCLGCVLFAFPALALFNRATLVAGIPVAALYLFGAWIALIALGAWVLER